MFKDLITSENFKKVGTVVSVLGTLFGIVNFGVSKLAAYDSYGPRLSKIEARESEDVEFHTASKEHGIQITYDERSLDTLTHKVDDVTRDTAQLRLELEHLRFSLDPRR